MKNKVIVRRKKEEQDKIWSRVPKGGPIPRRIGRLTVGRKNNSNSSSNCQLSCHEASKLISVVSSLESGLEIR
jgi:hypothetical protein